MYNLNIILVQANMAKQFKTGNQEINPQTFSSEGVEGYIPYMGPLQYVIQGFANGIKSGMSYTGATTIKVHIINKVGFTVKSKIRENYIFWI